MIDENTNFLGESSTPFNLRLFFIKYLRFWYWFAVSIALAIGGAYWYLRYTVPIYQVSASFIIESQPKNVGENIVKDIATTHGNKIVENEIEILKSRNLMLRVVDDLNLSVGYFKQIDGQSDEDIYGTSPVRVIANSLNALAYQKPMVIKLLNQKQYALQEQEGKLKGIYAFNQNTINPFGNLRVTFNDSLYTKDLDKIKIVFYNREEIAQFYKSAIKVELLNQKSTVLKITLEDPLPAKGKAVLRKLLETYTYSISAAKDREATNTLQFIDERLRLITNQLATVERDVESYKSSKGITDLSAEGNIYLGAVKINDTKLNEVDLQIKMLEGLENYLNSSQSGAAPATLASNDPILSGLLTKLNGLQTQQDKYARTTQAENPFLQTINGQINNTKIAIRENVSNQKRNLLITRAGLQRQSKHFESSIRTIPSKERELVNIKRQQSIKESLYLLLLQKKEEMAISYASSILDSRIVDEPYSPPYPIKPNRLNIYLVALLAGLLVPIGAINARRLLDNTIQTRKEIENVTGLTVFGEIKKKNRGTKDNLITSEHDSFLAEQFKTLRADLRHLNSSTYSEEDQILLITSSINKEGKSFVAINLAHSLAQLGKRVLILELDLRMPKIANYLGMIDGKFRGVTDYLNNKDDIDDLIRPVAGHPNMYLMPSGPLPSNPSELLSNEPIRILLKELRQRFDYIIIDAPPVTFVADAVLLAPYIDKVFYIIRYGYTPRSYMQFLFNLNNSQKFKSINVIFNGIDNRGNQEYKYGYAYKYVNNNQT